MWDDSVRKLVVVDNVAGRELGILYCDLFHRKDKNNHGSHYTLQSGRRMCADSPGTKPQQAIVALVSQIWDVCVGEKTGCVSIILLTCSGLAFRPSFRFVGFDTPRSRFCPTTRPTLCFTS